MFSFLFLLPYSYILYPNIVYPYILYTHIKITSPWEGPVGTYIGSLAALFGAQSALQNRIRFSTFQKKSCFGRLKSQDSTSTSKIKSEGRKWPQEASQMEPKRAADPWEARPKTAPEPETCQNDVDKAPSAFQGAPKTQKRRENSEKITPKLRRNQAKTMKTTR